MLSKNIIKVEAAGAGKTYGICEEALGLANEDTSKKKVLILSYTNRGIDSIKTEIRNQNFGVLSKKIEIMTWYRFLLGELIKPYQSVIFDINEVKSIDFSEAYGKINFKKKGTKERYMNSLRDIRSNVAGELACYIDEKSKGKTIRRIGNIYSHIYIDEVQDMAGYDLNIIELLMKSNISVTCVGDSKQATFKTNNSAKNKNKSGIYVWDFFREMIQCNIVEIKRNLVSRRFNQQICDFANDVFPNENNISTCMDESTEHDGVIILKRSDVNLYYAHFKPTVLRFNCKTLTDSYYAINFGECKGMTFERVLIYPNGVFKDFLLKKKVIGSPQKYYVAATRAKYSIAFVLDVLPKETDWLKKDFLNVGSGRIEIRTYITKIKTKEL